MNGNEVSCISDFYDIENLAAIEDARFYNEPKIGRASCRERVLRLV